MTLETLSNNLESGELNLMPVYQRGYVWDERKASRLIVTALMQRIVPPVFMHEQPNHTWDVVDGKQRLSALLTFIRGAPLRMAGKAPAHITGLPDDDEYADLNGLRFAHLHPEDQRRLRKYSLQVVVIKNSTDPSEVFRIYEDINSGGQEMTTQQLRRAAFWGPYIRMLDALAAHPLMLEVRGGAAEPDNEKEHDRELILRFFARHHRLVEQAGAQRALKAFLNEEIVQAHRAWTRPVVADTGASAPAAAGAAATTTGASSSSGGSSSSAQGGVVELEFAPERRERMEAAFVDALDVAVRIFGADSAFRKYQPSTRSYEASAAPHPYLWEVKMAAIAELLQRHGRGSGRRALLGNADAVRGAYEASWAAKEWPGRLTSTKAGFEKGRNLLLDRFSRAAGLAASSGGPGGVGGGSSSGSGGSGGGGGGGAVSVRPNPGPRAFPAALRQRLYEASGGRCALCGNRIMQVSHAEVDHVIPWALGGATAADNAQLTCRQCNRAKGARVIATDSAADAGL